MTPGRTLAAALGVEWRYDHPLVLPEVWDVASARMLEAARYPVLTTSASAYAAAQGYRPHERVNLEELLIVAGRIARDCNAPLLADLEGCFDRSNQYIKRATLAALAIGCKGTIVGDGGRDGLQQMLSPTEVANRIKAARIAEMEAHKKLFLIARTDAFHLAAILANPFEDAVARANLYAAAGADLIHVAGIQNREVVAALVKKINAPLLISVAGANPPNIAGYRDLGVAGISLGTGLMRAALSTMSNEAGALLTTGEFTHLRRAMSENELSKALEPPAKNTIASRFASR